MRSKRNTYKKFKRLMPAFCMAAFLAACSPSITKTSSDGLNGQTPAVAVPGSANPARAEVEITIENFAYSPSDITIKPGTRVTWTNKDDAPHTATSTEGKFRSEAMDTGDKYSFVFDEQGSFPYFCALHPQMKARITVQ